MQQESWPVSTTGGEKISGHEAAKILGVSYATVHALVKRGELKRAEPRKRALQRQPLVFFKADVMALADEPEEAENPNPAAGRGAAA